MAGNRRPLTDFFDESTRRSFLRKSAIGIAGAGVGGSSAVSGNEGHAHTDSQADPMGEFDYPHIDFTVRQESGKSTHWVLPGTRRLSEYTFGTPDTPYMTPDHWIDIAEEPVADLLRQLPVEGVAVDRRATNPAGTEFTHTTFPTPFSDKARQVDGELEVTYKDRQPYDTAGPPGHSEDDASVDVEFTDPAGHEYTIQFKKVIQPPYPNYQSGGGVLINNFFHGVTGTGTPLEPRQLGYGALWGLCDLVVDGEVVGMNRAVHVMTTEIVRDQEYNLATTPELPLGDDAYLGAAHHTHFIMPPVKMTQQGPAVEPVPTAFTLPNGKTQPFVHVMFDEDTFADLTVEGADMGEDADPVAGFFDEKVDVGLRKVVGGLTAPTDFAVADEDRDRWFVADQTGEAYFHEDGGLHQFLSVDDRIVELGNIYGQYPLEQPGPQYDERGLLGIEFHPDFASNRKFYLHYSAPPDDDLPETWDHYNVFVEARMAPDMESVESGSFRELLRLPHPQMNHNAGPMAFGPDGYLYLPMGDGGGANDDMYGHVDDWYGLNAGGNAQNVTENLFGTVLRVDPDGSTDGKPYGIPEDNPLVGTDGLDEIYAWGLRNPFGISFDSNGNLFQADAGQALYEEINVILGGGNYGWNVKEGTHSFNAGNHDSPPARSPDFAPRPDGTGAQPLIDPVVEWPHQYQGERVGNVAIGGYVYEGDAIPDLQGTYVYGAFHATHGNGRLLTAAPPGGEIGEVTLDDLEPEFPDDADVPTEYVPRPGDPDSEMNDALFDTNNRKDEIPRDELWDMGQLDVAGTDDGTPNFFVRMFGQGREGELYVLGNNKPIPTGETGAVYKLVPPEDGDQPAEETRHYQVDFVEGQPITELGEDGLYAEQDRLLRFAFGTAEEGITEKGNAWPTERIRDCVEYSHIRGHDGDRATVEFTVADGCELTLSLVTYSMSGAEFDPETADQQELLAATTNTYGPGAHTIEVELPEDTTT